MQDQEVVVVDDLAMSEPKTKEMAGVLKALKLGDLTCLIGTAGLAAERCTSRPGTSAAWKFCPTAEFNAYCVLRPKRLLLTKAASRNATRSGRQSVSGQAD